jgi:hypothetical protein
MTLLIQKNQSISDLANNSQISDEGWITTDLQWGRGESEIALSNNLPLAARRAEQLMDVLEDELSMPVSVSYIRVETGILFHLLLLISREDFLSPKMQVARAIAERFAQINSSYDIRFAFAIESENMMQNIIRFNGYRLLHIR